MDWLELTTQEQIDGLLKSYGYFEDSVIVSFLFETGNYVDSEREEYIYDTNNLIVKFERMDDNPFAIELLFERTRRINCIFPIWEKDNWISDIMYAKIVHNDEFYYWTMWRDFDPYNEEHLNYSDVFMIEAQSIKWHCIE